MTQKQFERLLYQHAGADRKTAEELAHHLYFHNRRRWLFEWGKAWVHQVGEEADKMEGRPFHRPARTDSASSALAPARADISISKRTVTR